jgi:hypothetical protein
MLAMAASIMTLPLTRPTFAQESQQPQQSQQSRESQEAQERAKVLRYGQQCTEQVDRVAPQSGSGVVEPSGSGQRVPLYRSCLDSNGVIPGSLGYFGRSN